MSALRIYISPTPVVYLGLTTDKHSPLPVNIWSYLYERTVLEERPFFGTFMPAELNAQCLLGSLTQYRASGPERIARLLFRPVADKGDSSGSLKRVLWLPVF